MADKTHSPASTRLKSPRLPPKQRSTCHACAPQTTISTPAATRVTCFWSGNSESQGQNVQPYYDQSDLLHSQMLSDIFGSFFRTSDHYPDPAFLKVRGPAYAATYEIFGRNKYRVPAYYPKAKNISLLGMPPSWKENPGLSTPCTVFDKYGYTFQHV